MPIKIVKKSIPVGGLKKKKKLKTASEAQVTTVKFPDGSVTEKHTETQHPFEVPVCDVQLSAGQTVNIGNYNSVRFSVSLKMPCEPKDVDSTYEFVKNWVDNKMQELQQEVQPDKKKEAESPF